MCQIGQINLINIFLCLTYEDVKLKFGCQIFDIRRTADQIEKIRHPKKRASDVDYSTFDGRPFESKKSDTTNKANRIYDIRSDRMHTSNANIQCNTVFI